MSALVFAPTPTHPAIQGNRQRAVDMCRALQSMGADLTFLYYGVDGVDAKSVQQMKDAWGSVEIVFPRAFMPAQTLVRYPAIDDWYDSEIGAAALRLAQSRRFDVCLVNYAWYSKIFESLPAQTVKIIDTHDIFGGRAQRFSEFDLSPEWFHTSVQQEAVGLDRADFVIAIQDEEARILRERTRAKVFSIGMLSEPTFLPPPELAEGRRLRAGYIGSGNPFNVLSLSAFARALQVNSSVMENVEVCVAGAVCTAFEGTSHPLTLLGVVDSIESFYRSVDVVINPMLGGTGLKIKSLEALAFGKPLLATPDAMAGIQSGWDFHRLDGPNQIIDRLRQLRLEPQTLERLARASREVFQSYRRTQLGGFSMLWSDVEREVQQRREARPRHGRTQDSLERQPG